MIGTNYIPKLTIITKDMANDAHELWASGEAVMNEERYHKALNENNPVSVQNAIDILDGAKRKTSKQFIAGMLSKIRGKNDGEL